MIFYYTTVNQGGHYSTVTGEYTCPVNGLYFFSVMLESDWISTRRGSRGPCAVLKNGHKYLAFVRLYNKNQGDASSVVSGSVVARCEAGDRVYVVSAKGNSHLYTEHYERSNVFSGFLIVED